MIESYEFIYIYILISKNKIQNKFIISDYISTNWQTIFHQKTSEDDQNDQL